MKVLLLFAVASVVGGFAPTFADEPKDEKIILTPPAPKSPRINGPKIYGLRPGSPFLFRIPATGERPLRFAVDGLPDGLVLDEQTGIISGRIESREKKSWQTTVRARNGHGKAERSFRIVVGATLALTPPMGWNSWYIHYHRVTEQHIRGAAKAMMESGMADYGYQYVNIDDCWMKKRGDPPYRDAEGAVLPNAKFPQIRQMVQEIHTRGLKAGIYTSPGPWTCAGYVGAHQHEEADARRFAEWGFDFLKYDWCSYGSVARGQGPERLQHPYRQMTSILAKSERDLVFNLCQYGMGEVWTWGGKVGGNCWRTTGDLGLERGDQLAGFYRIGLKNAQHWRHAQPGQWNDPDYILIGWTGDARQQGVGRPTSLSANEQYSYMSLWCLMAAPLIFSGDMQRLDEFTLNVLCNHEVIDVDQDLLGKQARIVRQSEEQLILAKPLEDGSLAVGLFSLAQAEQRIEASWTELGLEGPRRARDLWRQQDLGRLEQKITATLPRHGVLLVRLWPAP